MIRYALVCEKGHAFESWFQDSAAYDKQAKRKLVDLPALRFGQGREGDHGAAACRQPQRRGARRGPLERPRPRREKAQEKAPVAMISPQEQEFRSKLKELRDHLTKNADHVGAKFPEEARKMHYGETEHRSIYGEASPEDAKALAEEGIEFHPLPILPDERN